MNSKKVKVWTEVDGTRNHIFYKEISDEISRNYLLDMLRKRKHGLICIDLLTESDFECLFKCWLLWQKQKFKVSHVGEEHFLAGDGICKLINFQNYFEIISPKYKNLYCLTMNDKSEIISIVKEDSKSHRINSLIILNPQPDCSNENHVIACNSNGPNICPIQLALYEGHNGLSIEYSGKLLDVDTNLHIARCCWIRESWYGCFSHHKQKLITEHTCTKLKYTIYSSVIHGLVIGRTNNNGLICHDMYRDTCKTICPWLETKYIEATAICVYTNMLFVGTRNSYLLVYRLNNIKDFECLQTNNKLLEEHLSIGQIVSLEIMDYKNYRIIAVASNSSVIWLQIS
ncbi:uncharacterized protein LOC126899149 isoform X2 [Daktulosphaira vitifoliae]|uniref:uncharacterized protein LOC126899149 isoform X2 n=1 Tax=Daktulosphaira vitifoliae TaxID=58002 RepID=UPI0021A9AB60|nr:uncharacterized protein LOC126899149 isoform X2 [Daktulosphaira vitifoliae]